MSQNVQIDTQGSRSEGSRARVLAAVVAALLLTAIAWWLLPWPLVWTSLGWLLAGAVIALFSTVRSMRLLAVNLVIFSFGFFVAESTLWVWPELGTDKPRDDGIRKEGDKDFTETPVEPLGYRPFSNRRVHSRLLREDRVLYDVEYSYGENGLRATPPPAPDAPSEAALFFGGSFTLGEGVSDEESMPFQFAERLDRRVHAFNFGFHGYGAHQMLAAIETGLVDRILGDLEPRLIVYQAIVGHARRAAGKVVWDTAGPRYRLTETGGVEHVGRFDLTRNAHPLLERSSIGRRILAARAKRTTDRDRRRLAAIVARARAQAQERWPGAAFHVLMWDRRKGPAVRLEHWLDFYGVPYRLASEVIPDFLEERARYEIPYDRHPNGLAHGRIADWAADLLKREGSLAGS